MQETKYILYARKSTDSEDKQVQSIEDQLVVMRNMAKQRGLTVVETLTEAKSAKAPFTRAEFTKLLAMLEAGDANGILCWHINRLSRNPTENGILQQMLQDEKIQVIRTHDRAYLPDDNAVIFSVEASIANQYIRELRKNVKRGIVAKVRAGGLSGVAPQGYINNRLDKTVELDPERAPIIRRAFDMFLTGEHSVPEVLDALNNQWGFRTVSRHKSGGGPMSRATLYTVFRNVRYAGLIPDPYEKDTLYKAAFPALISLEEYDRVQELLGSRGCPRLVSRKQAALRGFIHCGECGCAITSQTKKKLLRDGSYRYHTYYHCTGKRAGCTQKGTYLKESDLFGQVNRLLDRYELSPELETWAMDTMREMVLEQQDERASIATQQQKTIRATELQLDKLLDLVSRNLIGEDEFTRKSGELKRQLKTLQADQARENDRMLNWYDYMGKTVAALTDATEKFTEGDLGIKKDILLAIGQNPVLIDGKLKLTPHPWLIPIEKGVPAIRAGIEKVRTMPQQMRKASEEALRLDWCPGLDSNQRP